MKHLFIALSLLSANVVAQELSSTFRNLPGVNEVYFNRRTNAPAYLRFEEGKQPDFLNFQAWTKENLHMRVQDGLALVRSEKDMIGYTHHRYQQTFAGIPVEWATYIVHEKKGKVVSINGDYHAALTPANVITLTPDIALQKAIEHIGAIRYKWENTAEEQHLKQALHDPDFSFGPKGTLVLLPEGEGAERTFNYAYKFDIWADQPEGRWDLYVDAATGDVIQQIEKIYTTEVTGTTKTKYSGNRVIQTDSVAPNVFRLRESRRGAKIETYDMNTQSNFSAAVDFIDSNNVWENFNAEFDEVATDAHWGAEMTYDYYKNELNRNSFNNTGSPMLNYVHFSKNWGNASWDGTRMRYGDGNNKPFTGLDVVGHEFSHGVTGTSAALVYQKESGALNESFSDVFGNAIELYARPEQSSWLIGEDFAPLRDMSNPNKYGNPDTYEGKYWTDTKNCTPGGGNDNCGVHNNSGVQNFWYYLLSEGSNGEVNDTLNHFNDKDTLYSVDSIGYLKAAAIAYRNLTSYLTQQSDYLDARFFSIKAATDLFGENSNEVIQVTNAWHAVGLGKRYSFLPISDFAVEEVLCTPGSTVKFLNTSGSATDFIWKFGDGEESEAMEPSHTYKDKGSYHVTLIAINANGSDTLARENYVNIYEDAPVEPACTAAANNALGTLGIYNVTMSNISRNSLSAKEEGSVKNFTCDRIKVAPGYTYDISIKTNSSTEVFTRVWIDYNNDGIFSEDELAFKTDTTVYLHKGQITIPTSAGQEIPLRMRVSSSRSLGNTPDNPCATVKSGQVEEYSVLISPSFVGVENNVSKNFLMVYPNPAKGFFNLSYSFEGNKSIRTSVINLLGEEVYGDATDAAAIYSKTINTEGLAKGVYFVKVSDGVNTDIQKIIIQ